MLSVPGFLGGVQGQLDHGWEDSVRHALPSGQQAGHTHPLQQVGQVLGGALPHHHAQMAADNTHKLNMKDANKDTETTSGVSYLPVQSRLRILETFSSTLKSWLN